jgi:hypothetical protein
MWETLLGLRLRLFFSLWEGLTLDRILLHTHQVTYKEQPEGATGE